MERIRMVGGGTAMTNCPFPIGYGGFFQIDPNTIYSGTTWEQKKDVFILAAGTAYPAGSTGGEATHTLELGEIPRHSHVQMGYTNIAREGTKYGQTRVSVSQTWGEPTIQTGMTGGSQPHNNMPPYFAMPFWIRTA